MPRCNAYGSENKGGHAVAFGGLLDNPIVEQHECHAAAEHRFTWICEHGHRGEPVWLCEWHYAEFSGRPTARFEGGEGVFAQHNGQTMTVPWNMRRDVQACPRCASEAPPCTDPDHARMMRGQPGRCGCTQHKCRVELVTVS